MFIPKFMDGGRVIFCVGPGNNKRLAVNKNFTFTLNLLQVPIGTKRWRSQCRGVLGFVFNRFEGNA